MSVRSVVVMKCSEPTCDASVTVLDTVRSLVTVPHGWVMSTRSLVACPEHSAELRAADNAAYEWAVRRTEDLNRARREVIKRHPKPRNIPPWLAPVWKQREDEL